MPTRTIGTVDRKSVRLSGYFIEFEADLGVSAPGAKWPTYKRHTLRIPIWGLRLLIRGAREAYRREAANLLAHRESILSAASRESEPNE